jgi:hypothetical protein
MVSRSARIGHCALVVSGAGVALRIARFVAVTVLPARVLAHRFGSDDARELSQVNAQHDYDS